MTEIVIKGGTVVDGTGTPGRRADVAIDGGRIVGIGEGLEGDRELDASGCVVAPGFIDIHTHYDAQVFWDPALTPSCYHGVTTVVAGNCGFSIAPTHPEHRTVIARTLENVEDMNVATLTAGIPWDFETHPEYLASIRRRGTYLNFGAYIGHTALRLWAMGDDAYERIATPEEVARMQEIVREAMQAGAMGVATTFAITHRGIDGKPVPSRHAELSELIALGDVLRELGKGVIHVTPGPQMSVPEIYDFQRRVGVPVTYAALLTSPSNVWREQAELNNEQRALGANVWPQVSPRPLVFSMSVADPFTLNPAPMFAELMKTGPDERMAAYSDPDWRARAVVDLTGTLSMSARWNTFSITESMSRPDVIGRKLTDVAEEWGCHPIDVLLQVAVDDKLETRVQATIANDDDEGVAFLLQQENCTLGLSDAGAHVGQLCDAPQATSLLGRWVREEGVISVETAVRKLSGRQADIFGLGDRGYVKEGYAADLAVFDPATIAPGPVRRVRDFPGDADRLTADAPSGVNHVIVNGTPIQVDGRPLWGDMEQRPGKVVSPS